MSNHHHLSFIYPELSELLDNVPILEPLEPQPLPVAEAVTKIVVGQMLSRVAAESIYSRILEARISAGVEGSWKVPEQDLQACGLSRRKIRTIREFAECYQRDPSKIEEWRFLSYEDLTESVSQHWGLSQWSADMLAIFHFAHPDVFPKTDGTIIRVRRILEERYLSESLDPELARPYRTSLARYMWSFVDRGILD